MQDADWGFHLLHQLRVGVDVKPGWEQPAARPHLSQTCNPRHSMSINMSPL